METELLQEVLRTVDGILFKQQEHVQKHLNFQSNGKCFPDHVMKA